MPSEIGIGANAVPSAANCPALKPLGLLAEAPLTDC